MSVTTWIVLASAAIVVAGYLLVMRVLYLQSREADSHVDLTKIKPLKSDDEGG
jgi:hypothetical protein